MENKILEWSKIQNNIYKLHNNRKYDESLRLGIKGLAFARANFGVKNVCFANCLILIALNLLRLDDYKKAEKLCDQAAKIYGLIKNGRDSQVAAMGFFNLTTLFMDMELYEKAMNSIILTAKIYQDYKEIDIPEIYDQITTIIMAWEEKDGLDTVEKFFRKLYKKASTEPRTEEKKIELLWAFHFLAFFFAGLENKQKRAAILNKHVLDTLLKSPVEHRAQTVSILARAEFYLTMNGEFPEALEVSQKTIEALTRTKTPETGNMTLCLSFISMAHIYFFLDEYEKAFRIYQKIFSKLEEVFDYEQPQTNLQLNKRPQLGRVRESVKYCLKGIMSIYRIHGQIEALTETGLYLIERLKRVVPEHIEISSCTNSLFFHNPKLLKNPGAEKLLLYQLSILEKNMPEYSLDMSICLSHLSTFYSNAKRYEMAVSYKHQALELENGATKGVYSNTIHDISSLGELYWKLNDSETAEKYYEQAIHACEQIDDKGKWLTIKTLIDAASFYNQNFRYDKAYFYCHKILSILRENNWIGHPGEFRALEILAEIQKQTGRGRETINATELADNAQKNIEPIYQENLSAMIIN